MRAAVLYSHSLVMIGVHKPLSSIIIHNYEETYNMHVCTVMCTVMYQLQRHCMTLTLMSTSQQCTLHGIIMYKRPHKYFTKDCTSSANYVAKNASKILTDTDYSNYTMLATTKTYCTKTLAS